MNNNSSKPLFSQCLPDNGAEKELEKLFNAKKQAAIRNYPTCSHDHKLFKTLVSTFYPDPADLNRLKDEFNVSKPSIDKWFKHKRALLIKQHLRAITPKTTKPSAILTDAPMYTFPSSFKVCQNHYRM